MYDVLNKNDIRYQTTHATIRNAYKELLSQKHYLSISVTEICKLANINRGTFYIHYKDSASVMNEFEDEIYLRMTQLFDNFISKKDFYSELSYRFSDYIKSDDGDLIDKTLNGEYGSGKLPLRLSNYMSTTILEIFSNSNHLSKRQLELLSAFISSSTIGVLHEWHKTNYENIEEETVFIEEIINSILKIYKL